jgi:hypothetical protein
MSWMFKVKGQMRIVLACLAPYMCRVNGRCGMSNQCVHDDRHSSTVSDGFALKSTRDGFIIRER